MSMTTRELIMELMKLDPSGQTEVWIRDYGSWDDDVLVERTKLHREEHGWSWSEYADNPVDTRVVISIT